MSSHYYKRLLRNANGELSNYRHRKRQLESIRDGYSRFDGYATTLNDLCNSALVNSNAGIKLSRGSNDSHNLLGKRDSGYADNNLSTSRNYINSEIRRVQDMIDELERDIASYKRSIEIEEQKEREQE